MVITVAVVHTEETPYMKKLARTGDFGAYHVIFHDVSSSASFSFKIRHISTVFPPEGQTGWIQIRPNILLGLIWVKPVCKDIQQTTQIGKELN